MNDFDSAKNIFLNNFENEKEFEKVEEKQSKAHYKMVIDGVTTNILLLRSSVTGTERDRPQIRVFWKKIQQLAKIANDKNEKFFCFIHCSTDYKDLKMNETFNYYDFFISLESDWNIDRERIDIRSIYDKFYDELKVLPGSSYIKLNISDSNSFIRFASAIDMSDKETIYNYMKYYETRIIESNSVNELLDTMDISERNVIYYGAPGTGKSYEVTSRIKEIYPDFENTDSESSKFVFRTTLHPEYTYSDFVGQILPNVEEDRIEYTFTAGIFTRALKRAISEEENEQSSPIFLVLEELSRSNVSAVFGDLFQLLDRQNGQSEYSITNPVIAQNIYGNGNEEKKVYLPRNLFILGTVNTNDQNVFVMDTAFKRRFDWEYISTKPKTDDMGIELNNPIIQIANKKIRWCDFYQNLNLFITKNLGLSEDKQIGQFFIKFPDGSAEEPTELNQNKIKNKLLQYLWDDVQKALFNGKSLFY